MKTNIITAVGVRNIGRKNERTSEREKDREGEEKKKANEEKVMKLYCIKD